MVVGIIINPEIRIAAIKINLFLVFIIYAIQKPI